MRSTLSAGLLCLLVVVSSPGSAQEAACDPEESATIVAGAVVDAGTGPRM